METERKLVTLRKVSEIRPIEGADKIEVAIIDGWQCVVKKGEFKAGDFGLYFEIDSFLPLEERYAFLKHKRKDAEGIEGYRLKTAKFRGTLSQGLLLPLSSFPELVKETTDWMNLDISLGVKKFEVPIPAELRGVIKGLMPGFLHKTDQERIQNLPEHFMREKETEFERTEKINGTSATYFLNKDEFGVCSRNLEYKETAGSTYWQIARDFDIEKKLRENNTNIAIQGEIFGAGINGNPYSMKSRDFMVFDIWSIDYGNYFPPETRRKLTDALGLKHVPVIDPREMTFEKYPSMETLLESASGPSMIDPQKEREGVVLKACKGDVSFKVVSNTYLLEEKE